MFGKMLVVFFVVVAFSGFPSLFANETMEAQKVKAVKRSPLKQGKQRIEINIAFILVA